MQNRKQEAKLVQNYKHIYNKYPGIAGKRAHEIDFITTTEQKIRSEVTYQSIRDLHFKYLLVICNNVCYEMHLKQISNP